MNLLPGQMGAIVDRYFDDAFSKAASVQQFSTSGAALVAMDRHRRIKVCDAIDVTFGTNLHKCCSKQLAMASALKHGFGKFLFFTEVSPMVVDQHMMTVADPHQSCQHCKQWFELAMKIEAYPGSNLGMMLEPDTAIYTRHPILVREAGLGLGIGEEKFVMRPDQLRHLTMQRWQAALFAAEKIQEFAWSYRNFQVGVALVAMNAEGEDRIFTGANIKFAEGAHKCCGEMVAIGNALKRGYRKFISFGVVGPLLEEGTYTLLPCDVCRTWLAALTEIEAYPGTNLGPMLAPDAMLFTRRPIKHHRAAHAIEMVNDYHTVKEALAIYGIEVG